MHKKVRRRKIKYFNKIASDENIRVITFGKNRGLSVNIVNLSKLYSNWKHFKGHVVVDSGWFKRPVKFTKLLEIGCDYYISAIVNFNAMIQEGLGLNNEKVSVDWDNLIIIKDDIGIKNIKCVDDQYGGSHWCYNTDIRMIDKYKAVYFIGKDGTGWPIRNSIKYIKGLNGCSLIKDSEVLLPSIDINALVTKDVKPKPVIRRKKEGPMPEFPEYKRESVYDEARPGLTLKEFKSLTQDEQDNEEFTYEESKSEFPGEMKDIEWWRTRKGDKEPGDLEDYE